jgi:hypothetical protein
VQGLAALRGIGLGASVIRTFEGADGVVPNGQLLSGSLASGTILDRSGGPHGVAATPAARRADHWHLSCL